MPASGQLLPIDPPILGPETPRGTWTVEPLDPVTPSAGRAVDGDPGDWIGEPSLVGGTTLHSAGELIYTDHLFDAYGADDGRDRERRDLLGPLEALVPEAYRAEAGLQANLPGQVGVSTPEAVRALSHYGNLDYRGAQDLVEVRLAADDDHLWVLARTAQMSAPDETALLVLFDTGLDVAGPVPFNAGIETGIGDHAVLLAGDQGWVAPIGGGPPVLLPSGSVATNPAGFTNAIEAAIPLALIGSPQSAAAATGRYNPAGPGFAGTGLGVNLSNVAFRPAEPVREWFDHDQAFALGAGTIDPFFHPLDLDGMRGGRTEQIALGPGYHERVFRSTTPGLAQSSGREGLYQHYGLYLPSAITEGEPLPLTVWLHWRGGTAHVAGALTPGIFRHMGENRGGIVVSPRGRGTSTWYVGRGHADFLEVWEDAFATLPLIDPDRVYVSGHSMGGWGSTLLPILYPDRFAGAMPVAAPVTQGAWTGLDFPGCDNYASGEYTPCYISANNGRPRDQHTRPMLDNLRNVPIGLYYAGADELVPIGGAIRQHDRLIELGYQHRFYLFPVYEHYSHPVVDEWADGVRYLDGFTRDPDPARVTYIRDLAFERAVNEVQSGGIPFSWTFDSAYWMSGLEVAPGAERARFDGFTHARPAAPLVILPDAAGPASLNQAGPFLATGLQWLEDLSAETPAPRNAFTLTLEGASRVGLDLQRMGIDVGETIMGLVRADVFASQGETPEAGADPSLELRLAGPWGALPAVTVNGEPSPATLDGDTLVILLQRGIQHVAIAP